RHQPAPSREREPAPCRRSPRRGERRARATRDAAAVTPETLVATAAARPLALLEDRQNRTDRVARAESAAGVARIVRRKAGIERAASRGDAQGERVAIVAHQHRRRPACGEDAWRIAHDGAGGEQRAGRQGAAHEPETDAGQRVGERESDPPADDLDTATTDDRRGPYASRNGRRLPVPVLEP